jgi:ABC-type dipeptide/oligopeptide/nickel transport system permease component
VIVIVVTAGLSSVLGTAGTEAAMFRDDEPDEGEPVTMAFVSLPSGLIGLMFLLVFNRPSHKFASNGPSD